MSKKEMALITEALINLLEEVNTSPRNPRETWLVSNEPNSGFVGTLSGISAREASEPPVAGMNSIASHTRHLRFALSLANRAMRGENPYGNADWPGSFQPQTVSDVEWDQLRQVLRQEHEQLIAAIRARTSWEDPMILQGVMAAMGHGAYHLGAVRQIVQVVRKKG